MVTTLVSPASAEPTVAPGEGAMNVEFYVPIAAATASDRMQRDYVSPATRSLLAIIDEPSTAQMNLQHRMESHNLSPDPNTGLVKLTLYAPPGSLTLQLKLYTLPNAKGAVLSITDKQNVTLDAVTPQNLNVTFNPVVAGAALQFHSTSSRLVFCTSARPIDGTYSDIFLDSGQITVAASDAAGKAIVGAGRFIDANGNPVTFSPAAYTGGAYGIYGGMGSQLQPISFGGVLTSPQSTGVYSLQFAGLNPNKVYNAWLLSMTSSNPALSGGTYIVGAGFCQQIAGG